jgi:hypothetical protein
VEYGANYDPSLVKNIDFGLFAEKGERINEPLFRFCGKM